ncbi:MAG: isoprenylcysteine carboxylmethyltransferase family protein [Candidatus Bathyarchaeota archaeon]
MDEEQLFRLLFVSIYAVFFGVRIRYRVESARRKPEKRQKIRIWPYGILVIAILSYLASIVLYMLDVRWVSWSRLGLPLWLRWLGVVGALASTVLVAWTHRVLGRQYAAEFAIQKDHVLVTTDPYARTRHPMYMALNAFSLSMALMTSNLLIIFFAVLVAVPFPWIAAEEERMLLETFGEEYREYMGRTGRFFPKIWQRP